MPFRAMEAAVLANWRRHLHTPPQESVAAPRPSAYDAACLEAT